jgi:hypothetical protein
MSVKAAFQPPHALNLVSELEIIRMGITRSLLEDHLSSWDLTPGVSPKIISKDANAKQNDPQRKQKEAPTDIIAAEK